ncbi:MAG: hypothetical protein ABIP75_13510 [Pyrinomonadaceae bacterium]
MANINFTKRWAMALMLAALVTSLFTNTKAQTGFAANIGDEKSEAVIKRAITLLGGDRYVNVTSVVSNGNFTQFAEGTALSFYSFNDYILYPDNERTEFKINGARTVQVNTGQSGWTYDGAIKAIKDMKPAQVQDFQWFVIRTSVENLLRGGWRSTGATLKHTGRREAGLGKRNDVLRLLYPDGFAAEFEFTPDGFPAKVIYTRKDGEGNEAKEEDRLAQWVEISGIQAPLIVDHYRGGVQFSRVNFKTVEFNKPLPPAFFTRPATAKDLK